MVNRSPILMPSAEVLKFKYTDSNQIRWRWCIYAEKKRENYWKFCERTYDDWWRTQNAQNCVFHLWIFSFPYAYNTSYTIHSLKPCRLLRFGLVFFSLTLLLIIRLHIMCECVRPLTIRCVVVRMSLILLLFFFSSPLSFSRLPKSKIVVCRSSYLILFCIVSYRKSTENIACKGEKGGINCKHRMR